MLLNPLFILQNDNEWGRNGSIKYPWRATDYIRELFDELACAGDDFVRLLLCGVSGKKRLEEKERERVYLLNHENSNEIGLCMQFLFYTKVPESWYIQSIH